MNFGMELTPCCGCDSGLRPAVLDLVSFSCRFELPPAVYAGLPSRSDVNSYVTANVYYVTFRYPCTCCSRVFQSRLFHYCDMVPRFPVLTSSPAFSAPPGVSGWVFLLVPAYPGFPGPKAVKRLCVSQCVCVCDRLLRNQRWGRSSKSPLVAKTDWQVSYHPVIG